jgi:flavin-dependent dehydrogenase
MNADVLIIGAGPAGSLAGCRLAKLGHRVIILEKETFPRFSIGESLLPQCMAFMEEAGMLERVAAEGFQLKNGASFSCAGRLTDFDFSDKFTPGWSTTYQVPRARFDAVLADAAAAAGADIRYRHRILAADVGLPDRVRLTVEDEAGDRREFSAALVLDASGFGRVLPRLLGLETPSSLAPRKALFTHVEDRIRCEDYDRNKILIAIHPECHEVWYWLIPFSDGRSSLGVVLPMDFSGAGDGDDTERLRRLAFEEPRLRTLLRDARFDTPVQSLGGYSANVERLWGERYVLLGNAGEFLDPVFSSGVTLAMKSASLAVPLVHRRLAGETVDFEGDFERPLRRGIEVFRAYVDAWYGGGFQRIIFDDRRLSAIKAMICSILAGYVWDEENPYTKRCQKKLQAMAELCPPLQAPSRTLQ